MIFFFPHQSIANPQDVRECVQEEFRRQAGAAAPQDVADHSSWDVVDLASWDSFPASDPPPWTLGYAGQPVAD